MNRIVSFRCRMAHH